ncbi:MAG: tetratricopeptide repeat protein [Saprospiraceae bacterium]
MENINTQVLTDAPIDDLLVASYRYYRRRYLKKALNNAQIAYDFASKAERIEATTRAALQLAAIYNTNGKYLGDTSYFPKALHFIQEAEQRLALVDNPRLEFMTAFIRGRIQQNTNHLSKANLFLEKALQIAVREQLVREKIYALTSLSQCAILSNDFNTALSYTEEALKLLDKKDEALLAEIYNQFGQIYVKKQEYSKSLEYSQYLLSISRKLKDIEKEITALNNIAIVSGVKTNYKIAIQYFLDALNKSKLIGYRHNIAHCLINIGTIYAHLYNYEEALERYEVVLSQYNDILDNNTKVIIYNNVGNIHYTNGEPQQAQSFFAKAHRLAQKCNYREMVAHSLAQLGRTKTALKDYDEALKIAQEAQIIIEELDSRNGKQINLVNLGDIYYQKQQPHKAIEFLLEGLEIAIELKDHTSEIRAYQLLALLYQQLEKYKKAFLYQFKYSTRKEEFAKIQDNRRFLDFEIKYAIKEKEKEIEQLTKENEYQALLLNKSDQINQQNEELIAMNEELRQFAYVASHDLKEPLRMIGSYTQLIQRLYRNKLDDESETYFNFISEGVGRMNNLLDALLQYATIGRTEEDEREIDLNNVVEICKVHLRVLLAETDAVIHFDNLPTVFSTQSLLIQLIQNLLSNAIKFRRPGVRPQVHIRAQETDEQYIIHVEDNGIGIDKEYLERIFIIFQRLHARTKYKGTGIGLSICQKIAKRLGGNIWVDSKLGEGSIFSFSIPKKENE